MPNILSPDPRFKPDVPAVLATTTEPDTATEPAAVQPRPRTDLPTVVLHGLLTVALGASMATGLRIAADASAAPWVRLLSPLLPQGAVLTWHLYSAYALTIIVVAYVLFLWRARLSTRVHVRTSALRSADHATRWQAINRTLYWVFCTGIVLQSGTGALLYCAPQLLPPQHVTTVHRSLAWGLALCMALHVLAQFQLGGVRRFFHILRPRIAYLSAGSLALVGAIAVGAGLYPLDRALIQPFVLTRLQQAPRLDGNPRDALWRQTRPAVLHTTNGSNLPGGAATVYVRGGYDDERAYLLFTWPDTTRSQKHLPLVKTYDGWQLVETKYRLRDEDTYYEDALSVMLSVSEHIGAGTTHLGPQPLAHKPGAPGQRGLHYTTDKSIVDVWHWKSVQTAALGQIDDGYFGPPLPAPRRPGERYTGGYMHDPQTGGGFEPNWTGSAGNKFVIPKRLPKNFSAMHARLGVVDLNPAVSDTGRWWMAFEDTIPYSKDVDTYAVDTIIPSVLIDKPFVGDRGDVTAVGTWHAGWWRLEVTRQRHTGSPFDLPIDAGIYLWVAVFDHTQTRHSRHLHPLRIVLQ